MMIFAGASRRGLARLGAACLLFAGMVGAMAQVQPAAPVSVLQIPIELDLAPLFEAAESMLPSQAGNWPNWRGWHGLDTRYRAWRGPLQMAMRGGVLQTQAHVRYQLQVRKGLIASLGVAAGCGVNEPPRQALIGALARLDWGPDWSLHPRFRVLPTRFLDRCEVTLADIDVSPLVGGMFEERMETTLEEAMHSLAPRLERLRSEAGIAWQSMQKPRQLTPGLWLQVQPLGIALAPLQGVGARVQTAALLTLRARLSPDPSPSVTPTPLPPLLPYRPSSPGMRFALELELDYPKVAAALSKRLKGQAVDVAGQKAVITGISLAAAGEDLTIGIGLSGDSAGLLTIMTRPGFDTEAQSLRLEDMDFVFDAADTDKGLFADLFYERIRARIQAEADRLLAQGSSELRDALSAMLTSALPQELSPTLSNARISELRIRVGKAGLAISGTVQGILRLGES